MSASQTKQNNDFSQGDGRAIQENMTLPPHHQRYERHKNLMQKICIYLGLLAFQNGLTSVAILCKTSQVSEIPLTVIKPKGEFTAWYNLEVQVWLDPGTHKPAAIPGSFLFCICVDFPLRMVSCLTPALLRPTQSVKQPLPASTPPGECAAEKEDLCVRISRLSPGMHSDWASPEVACPT